MASHLVVELYNQAPEYTFTERTPELSIQNRLDRGTLILTHGRAQPLVVIKRTGEKAFARPFDGHAPVTRANGKGETDHLAQGVIELDISAITHVSTHKARYGGPHYPLDRLTTRQQNKLRDKLARAANDYLEAVGVDHDGAIAARCD